MFNPIDFKNRSIIPYPEKNRDDIQFVLIPKSVTKNNVGHVVVVNYKHKYNIINIYDSDYKNRSIDSENYLKEKLKEFYGNDVKDIIFKKPISTQTDGLCGIYAIIYCVLLIQGCDPEKYILKNPNPHIDLNEFLREFIHSMFLENQLLEFHNIIPMNIKILKFINFFKCLKK